MRDEKNLWQGGLWEQDHPQYPTAPPVVIPPPSAYKKYQLEKERGGKDNLSPRAKAGFAGFLSLIFGIVCLSVFLGVRNSDGAYFQERFSDFFQEDSTKAKKEILDKSGTPPSIEAADLDPEVELEFTNPLSVPLRTQEIYEKCLPSVVFIEAQSRNQYATGTGVMMSEDGYIITNAHVIDGASSATVTLWDNMQYAATLVGYHYEQDLAVLKIEGEDFVAAEFTDSDHLQVGDPSYAMGNPLGAEYRSTFTDGMVSAVDRVLEVDSNSLVFLQTTAAINSGNSGGALINQYGQVVGITTIKIMSAEETIEGMGFAIPSKRVKQVVDRLLAGEEVISAMIGISVLSVSEPIRGLQVVSVTRDSNVFEAGMEDGDIILEANGKTIYSVADLDLVKGYLFVGDEIEYLIYRDGEEVRLTAELQQG